jgi:hypothetical protein
MALVMLVPDVPLLSHIGRFCYMPKTYQLTCIGGGKDEPTRDSHVYLDRELGREVGYTPYRAYQLDTSPSLP